MSNIEVDLTAPADQTANLQRLETVRISNLACTGQLPGVIDA
jgi:hypothetical protein